MKFLLFGSGASLVNVVSSEVTESAYGLLLGKRTRREIGTPERTLSFETLRVLFEELRSRELQTLFLVP